MDQQVSLEWMVALGCSLRGEGGTLKDKEINLSGAGAIDTFHREQFLNFIVLWSVIVPVVLGCLVIGVALADNFLRVTRSNVTVQPSFNGVEIAAMSALEASSTAFNQSVTLVANAEAQLNTNYLMINDIGALATQNGITVTHLSYQGSGNILVSGSAHNETQIVAFKGAVQGDSHYGTVDLPLSNIQQSGGEYTFSMEFPFLSHF